MLLIVPKGLFFVGIYILLSPFQRIIKQYGPAMPRILDKESALV
jgi:hypothetical protein